MFSTSQNALLGRTFDAQEREDLGRAATLLRFSSDEARADAQWAELAQALLPGVYPDVESLRPFERILEHARSEGCVSAVVEHRYVDPDFRSEFAVFWSQTFYDRQRETFRLHFFATELGADQLTRLSEEEKHSYIGYSVLRPTELGPVGRTVLRPGPDPTRPDSPAEGVRVVLTRVVDRPSLFGNDLEVTGVPFAQQDGELLRCAHIAAWVCGYVAWRNHTVGRHLTGQIAMMGASKTSAQRPLPRRA